MAAGSTYSSRGHSRYRRNGFAEYGNSAVACAAVIVLVLLMLWRTGVIFGGDSPTPTADKGAAGSEFSDEVAGADPLADSSPDAPADPIVDFGPDPAAGDPQATPGVTDPTRAAPETFGPNAGAAPTPAVNPAGGGQPPAPNTPAPSRPNPAPAPTPTVAPPPAPPVTFVNEQFGSNTANFDTLGGTWSAKGGRLVLSSPTIGPQDTGNNSLAVQRTPVARPFSLTLDGATTGTSSAFNDFSVVFGYSNRFNYWYASFNESDDPATHGLFQVINGTQTQVANFGRSVRSDRFYRVTVRSSQANLSVSLDGATVATVSTNGVITGRVGMGTRNDSATFDNLVAKPL